MISKFSFLYWYGKGKKKKKKKEEGWPADGGSEIPGRIRYGVSNPKRKGEGPTEGGVEGVGLVCNVSSLLLLISPCAVIIISGETKNPPPTTQS